MTEEQHPSTAPGAPASGIGRLRTMAICVALAAITLAVFGRTVTFGFVRLDDNDYVYKNPRVVQGVTYQNVVHAFTHADCLLYHPLTMLSHDLDCQLYGLNPAGHHATNILLHTATVILLFLLLRRMTGAIWRSAFVAAVFAIHPLHVESVAWVTERKDVLSGLFFVLTMGAYVYYARRRWSPTRYVLVLLLFACGLLSKPMLVTLPLVLLLLDYWPLNRWPANGAPSLSNRLLLEKVPMLLLSAASCLATLAAAKKAVAVGASFALPIRLGNAVESCVVYLGQMVWPVNLVVMYPFPRQRISWLELASAVAVLVGISAVAWTQRRTRPWLLTGWLWYLIMLLPVLGIIQAGYHAHADRFTYLPQIGVYMAVTWMAAEWRLSEVAFGWLIFAIVGLLTLCAWDQTKYWRDTDTLFRHALACTTDNDVIDDDLGIMLLDAGKIEEATFHLQRAVKANPDSAETHSNLGMAMNRLGKAEEAVHHFKEALRLDPDSVEAHSNLGMVLASTGKPEEAAAHYRKALQLDPNNPAIQNNLAWLLATSTNAAVRDGKMALDLSLQANKLTGGENLIILHTVAAAAAEAGKFSEAVATARRALRMAEAQSNQNFANQLQIELKLYEASQPYHPATDAIGPARR